MSATPVPPAPGEEGTAISIPRARKRAVSAIVAASLCVASLGIGFAGGRLTAPDDAQVPTGFPGGQLPSGFPSNLPSGFPSPPGGG